MIALASQPPGPSLQPLETPDVAWSGLAPMLVLVGAALLLITVTSLWSGRIPRGFYAVWTAAAGLATIATAVPLWVRVQDVDRGPFSTLRSSYGIDGFSIFVTMTIAAAVVLSALVLDNYLRREDLDGPEAYVLVLLSASGGVIMGSANDLIVMFVGLEVLSLAAYVLAASHLRRIESQEAGIKYFVLGALASAFFLYGISLTYGATGSTNLVEIQAFFASTLLLEDALLLSGFGLLLVGFGFKVAAAPFHVWTPDVYQGAPTPVTAFMASAVKTAAFAGLVRVFYVTFDSYRTDWQPVIYGLAIATLVVGSFAAVVQTDVKRMMAYSSISHAGFILVGVQAATAEGTAAVLFYLAAYTFMVIGTFAVVTLVAGAGDNHTSLEDYAGLARSRPLLALAFTVFLLGQAGVPFTTGFLAKFYVLESSVEARSYPLAVIAMLTAVVSAFVYLRIVLRMYTDDRPEAAPPVALPGAAVFVIVVCLGFTLVFGFWPQPIIEPARDAVPSLVFSLT